MSRKMHLLCTSSSVKPGGGHGNPVQYSCLQNPHGQRSLVGYSPWGCKKLDTTKAAELSSLFFFFFYTPLLNKMMTRRGPSCFWKMVVTSELGGSTGRKVSLNPRPVDSPCHSSPLCLQVRVRCRDQALRQLQLCWVTNMMVTFYLILIAISY